MQDKKKIKIKDLINLLKLHLTINIFRGLSKMQSLCTLWSRKLQLLLQYLNDLGNYLCANMYCQSL